MIWAAVGTTLLTITYLDSDMVVRIPDPMHVVYMMKIKITIILLVLATYTVQQTSVEMG